MAKCKVCSKEFEGDRQLHGHLKAHGMRMAEYYQKYFPRYDLYNNKIIKFKNKNQYLSSNFNNRKNLKLWLNSVTEDEAKGYCIDFLSTRIKEKNIILSGILITHHHTDHNSGVNGLIKFQPTKIRILN